MRSPLYRLRRVTVAITLTVALGAVTSRTRPQTPASMTGQPGPLRPMWITTAWCRRRRRGVSASLPDLPARGQAQVRSQIQRPPGTGAAERRVQVSGPSAELISCIMPTVDRSMYVAQALHYLRRQDHRAWELIVVDDGVRDTRDTLRTELDDPRIRYVRLPKRPGSGRRPDAG